MDFKHLTLIFLLLIIITNAMAVKIGVSKTTSTTTSTLAPNSSNTEIDTATTTTTPSSPTTIFGTEGSTLAAEINVTSTVSPKFPPKITKPTKKAMTTLKPTSTTSTPSPTTPVPSSRTETPLIAGVNFTASNHRLVGPNKFYCSCDLLPSTCDINCCCDPDCPKAILKVFDCFAPTKNPERRLPLEDFQYEHGLPSCRINDGWLCVFRTNMKHTSIKVQKFDFDTSNKFKWRSSLTELAAAPAHEKEQDFYKFGDPIRVLNLETLELEDFEAPISFKPPYCQLTEPIRHLISTTRKCLVTTLAAAQETKQKLIQFAASRELLGKPRDQITDLENLQTLNLKDLILTRCIRSSEGKNNVCQELFPLDNETDSRDIENWYASEVRIQISHNFTNLIGCKIELVEHEPPSNESPLELWQQFDVVFVAANESSKVKDISHQRLGYSGPLGYLQGEPIIVAKFVPQNASEELSLQNRLLDYFTTPRVGNNTFNLPSRRAGLCHKKYGKGHSINYGISTLTECTLRLDKDKDFPKLKARSNVTAVCVQLQQRILETLFNAHIDEGLDDLNELYVSSLGHPQNSSEKWLPLIVHNMEFPPIAGELASNAQTLICRNVLLKAAFEFHVGTFTENGIKRQPLVKNAVLKLGLRHDLEFMMDEEFEVPLTLTVTFFDLSLSAGSDFPSSSAMYLPISLAVYTSRLI